jgi:pSer/pThr/pTyr-binding forkhead associated (FHA) protein
VIVCPRCSKENQDHYKFCLGCGAELPRDAAHAPKSFTAPTPPAGVPIAPAGGGGFGAAPRQGGMGAPGPAGGFGAPAPAGGFGAPAPAGGFGAPAPAGGFGAPAPAGGFGAPAPAGGFGAPAPAGGFGAPASAFGGGAPMSAPAPMPAPVAAPAPAAAGAELKCTNCGSMNNPNFKFCGTCGAPMGASAPAMPAVAPAQPAAPVGGQRGTLVLIRADGSEGDSFPLGQRTDVGREAGGLFASDSYLSPRHATFTFGSSGLTVEDLGSLNGVYLRIASDSPQEVRDRSIFRIGQEIIRFERLAAPPMKDGVELMGSPSTGIIGRICLIIGRETNGNCYTIPAGGLHLGRERGDILFPDDGYVSGLHCRLHEEAGRLMITDVGSSNGTFLRILGPSNVPSGSMLLLGQQLFRAEF